MGVTYVFSLAKEHPLPKGDISDANNARLALKGVNDWFSPQTMTLYFKQLYCRKESFDTKKIGDYLYNPLNILFETAAREFKLIENEGYSVIVKWNHNDELIEQLKKYGPCYSLMKKLAKYSVNIHKYDFDALLKIGGVKEVAQGVFLVDHQLQYDDKLGLLTDNQWEEKLLLK
jgi:CRISPR-associated endonuclease/helicase Cas3